MRLSFTRTPAIGVGDWKATARRGKPYTRQYQEERSRTIMLMIDAGRMMSAEIEGMSKLDYAIKMKEFFDHHLKGRSPDPQRGLPDRRRNGGQ